MAFCWRADSGPTLNVTGLVACDFTEDPDQYCYETLHFVIFQGEDEQTPYPHTGSPHGKRIRNISNAPAT